jgi:serine/threonine protein kinase
MVMEYCPGGDLLQMVEEDKSFPEAAIRGFARDILQGLHYCHAAGLLFGDLKPSNLLVN